MFEKQLEEIKEKRKILNQSDSFEEIAKAWNEIKKLYEQCEAVLENISKEVKILEEAEQEAELKEDFKFNAAFERINEISQSVHNCEVEKLPKLIKEMHELKTLCLKKLEVEKVNMEEIK